MKLRFTTSWLLFIVTNSILLGQVTGNIETFNLCKEISSSHTLNGAYYSGTIASDHQILVNKYKTNILNLPVDLNIDHTIDSIHFAVSDSIIEIIEYLEVSDSTLYQIENNFYNSSIDRDYSLIHDSIKLELSLILNPKSFLEYLIHNMILPDDFMVKAISSSFEGWMIMQYSSGSNKTQKVKIGHNNLPTFEFILSFLSDRNLIGKNDKFYTANAPATSFLSRVPKYFFIDDQSLQFSSDSTDLALETDINIRKDSTLRKENNLLRLYIDIKHLENDAYDFQLPTFKRLNRFKSFANSYLFTLQHIGNQKYTLSHQFNIFKWIDCENFLPIFFTKKE